MAIVPVFAAVFAGSGIMCGDADLISGGLLTELKTTTKKPSLGDGPMADTISVHFCPLAGRPVMAAASRTDSGPAGSVPGRAASYSLVLRYHRQSALPVPCSIRIRATDI